MALFDQPSPPSSPARRRGRRSAAPRPRRRFKDNPFLLFVGILLLVAALAGLMTVATRSSRFAPDFLTEFVLYALSIVDSTMLVALLFMLARNVIKLVVERRRGLPFARFRAKLVTMLLGMTLIPAVLVLLVGSELISNSVDRWFNASMADVLQSAQRMASDHYHERQLQVTDEAGRLARQLGGADLAATDVRPVRDVVAPLVTGQRVSLVEVYRLVRGGPSGPSVVAVVDVASPSLPTGSNRASADRLAQRAATGQPNLWVQESLSAGGELIRAAAVIRRPDGGAVGVVVASTHLTGEFATRARSMTRAYERTRNCRCCGGP
jgi:nitrogen fixation/metabolism regulation signal transduction histidine kinase